MANQAWRSPLLARVLGQTALAGLLGLAGLWCLRHWIPERHLRAVLTQQVVTQADLTVDHIQIHFSIVDMHRHHEGLAVRQELEVLARLYVELCQVAYRRQQKWQLSHE